MSNVAIAEVAALPALIDRAAAALQGARTAAEVLEAREMAGAVVDMAKRAERLAKAMKAHDDLVAAAHRAQGDALTIEAQAKHRLADEYDAAQERGEVAARGGERSGREHSPTAPTVADLGITRKDVHEARALRDAERAEPGLTRSTIDADLAAGRAPTRAAIRRAANERLGKVPSAPAGADLHSYDADAGRSQEAPELVAALLALPNLAGVKADTARAAAMKLTAHADAIDPSGSASSALFALEPVSPLSSASRSQKAQAFELEREFYEEFWPQYPRKKAPKPALAAYLKARKAGAQKADIIAGAMRYAAECDAKGTAAEHIKYAQGWLNDQRWNDVPDRQSPSPARPASRVESALEGLATYGK